MGVDLQVLTLETKSPRLKKEALCTDNQIVSIKWL